MTGSDADVVLLPNGLTVLVQPLPGVESVAFSMLVPGGSASDPEGASGLATVCCDWLTRGAGQLENRAFSQALDALGVDRHEQVTVNHLTLQCVCLPSRLPAVLALYADMLRVPLLTEDEFEPCRMGAIHQLEALEDEPRQRVMLELMRRHFPHPWGQPPEGNAADLEQISPELARQHIRRWVTPHGAILGLAGKITIQEAVPLVSAAFEQWAGTAPLPLSRGLRGERHTHIPGEAAQTQIGLAFEAVPYRHPDYFAAWAAVSVLSGGMSSRLFTEVREKRGLVYSVYASLASLRDAGSILCYAGTTNERAQETLEVLLREVQRLADGIDADELQRAKTLSKSSLLMQLESSMGIASSIAKDWFHLGRVLPLSEIRQRIEVLTIDDVLGYLKRNPLTNPTVLTMGPSPLSIPAEPGL
jgi:predicted Zn-dependent peptidase